MQEPEQYDLVVVGGGINGVGIARDATGRGLRVLLCEKDDLAEHTSSASTKLIHGGLRYLEYYEFGLVRKALKEREVLLRLAPHIIWPLRFVMPHVASLRPAWMIRLGLFLYDHLSHRELLPASRGINLRRHPAGVPLVDLLVRGFVYSDAWVDDARLVVLNALDAKERGATILTHTYFVSAEREASSWRIQLRSDGQPEKTIQARAIVNAGGPWASNLLQQNMGQTEHAELRLVKGSHIITRKLFDHDHAYIFQNPDKRIIFAIPYENEFTLIGTTDLEYRGDPSKVSISPEEVSYLCDAVNTYFVKPITPADVVWSYSGVRPLLAEEDASNPSAVTRDYHLDVDAPENQAPLLSVFGGKITTYRRLAEDALDLLAGPLAIEQPAWTGKAALPGGDLPGGDFDAFLAGFVARHPWLPASLAKRYARAYGSRAERLLGSADSMETLGEELSPGLFEMEALYLMDQEWAISADDILWRRTKLGLHATALSQQRLADWLTAQSERTATLAQ
ncbi:glycerol-3-phosphate dehydrogenase [Herbaspirillum sp. RTI4]|uniref:glycerol-3-phosphate dehydrogenase n=1 Tax=Herbaspirillum sp. RTI4 TaxID=3048640 RepID=UPI002AB435A0|nr:glycerol-3-phosphate dehydrogenase [Herbaspirillum sp. RTI4]MDY7579957.1 glycerol-3-phosphate dehydrogenase [Herbaspirillum sp. RTI4]MEA9982899.1 glycerol-3-phosphate dehydrogenase [Herbaspirillum sp. RTI4]